MPNKIYTTIRSCFAALAAVYMVFMFPVVTFADTSVTCQPPKVTTSGVHTPTGSDANTFKLVCPAGSTEGVWQNDYYTYDPATNTRIPRSDVPVYYKYDCDGHAWLMTSWQYIASQDKFVQNWVASTVTPSQATNCPVPTPASTTPAVTPSDNAGDTSSGSAAAQSTGSTGTPLTAAAVTGNGSGLSSSNGTPSSGQTSVTGVNNTAASLNNTVGSNATSGSVAVFGNTSVGNATTGDAQAIATIANLLQSSGNALGPNTATFVSNIDGDVNGDLLLDPALIGKVQPASSLTSAGQGSLTINTANNTDQSINNDIDLAAKSGDANVTANTTVGNTQTGTASAVANVLNVINSAVSSGQSFLGVININGNLNGDILLPPNFIDQLLASNVPRVTINTNVNQANTTSQTINNTVNATAVAGTANVDGNTTAGNVTTGNATSNITAFNLTGSNVIGSNDLLVFVNVLGKWYGMIFNAPGATSAELGGGISQNLPSNTSLNEQNNTNQSIINNINVAAASGDANVTKNTTAGDVATGNANAAVNLLNVTNSNLSLANWFGVLFINVFGTWNGSFGIDTAAGNPALPAVPGRGGEKSNGLGKFHPHGGRSTASSSQNSGNAQPQLFRFVASTVDSSNDANTFSPVANDSGANTFTTAAATPQEGKVLAVHTDKVGPSAKLPTTDPVHRNFSIPTLGVLVGVGMLVYERIRSLRHA